MPEAKLFDLAANKKRLHGYIVRMIFFNGTSKTAPFYRQYRDSDYVDLDFDIMEVENSEPNHVHELIEDILQKENKEWVDSGFDYAINVDLLREYAETGNYREIAKKTNTNLTAVFKAIKELRKKIHEDFNNYNR